MYNDHHAWKDTGFGKKGDWGKNLKGSRTYAFTGKNFGVTISEGTKKKKPQRSKGLSCQGRGRRSRRYIHHHREACGRGSRGERTPQKGRKKAWRLSHTSVLGDESQAEGKRQTRDQNARTKERILHGGVKDNSGCDNRKNKQVAPLGGGEGGGCQDNIFTPKK